MEHFSLQPIRSDALETAAHVVQLALTPVFLLSGIAAYLSVRFLTRYFTDRSLRPFGIYCLVAGVACLVWFSVR